MTQQHPQRLTGSEDRGGFDGRCGCGKPESPSLFEVSGAQRTCFGGGKDGLDLASVKVLRAQGARVPFCSRSLTGLETPRTLLKHSNNTSLSVAMNLLAEGRVSAVVSSADTKAIMVLGRFCIGTMVAIRRPAIAKAFQGPKGQFYMLDLGANVRCSPDLLQQFARFGCALQRAHQTQSKDIAPRVALLNIGTEAGKGTSGVNAAARLIENDHTLHSVGFIEPSELFSGQADVIVCDGYAGNLVLKTIESMAAYLQGPTGPTAECRFRIAKSHDAHRSRPLQWRPASRFERYCCQKPW